MRRLRAMTFAERFNAKHIHVDVLAPLPAPRHPWVLETRELTVEEAVAMFGEPDVTVTIDESGVR